MVVNLSKLKSDFRIVTVTMYQTKKYTQAKKRGKKWPPVILLLLLPHCHCSRVSVKFPLAPVHPHGDPRWRRLVFHPFLRLFSTLRGRASFWCKNHFKCCFHSSCEFAFILFHGQRNTQTINWNWKSARWWENGQTCTWSNTSYKSLEGKRD